MANVSQWLRSRTPEVSLVYSAIFSPHEIEALNQIQALIEEIILWEAQKSSKTSSVALYVIINPGLFHYVLIRVLTLQDYRISTALVVSACLHSGSCTRPQAPGHMIVLLTPLTGSAKHVVIAFWESFYMQQCFWLLHLL